MLPTYFINHGGGPCFFLQPGPMRETWRDLEAYLRGFGNALSQTPAAILVISAHWQEDRPTVNAGAQPSLLFDYGGFPPHTYQLTWPSPGSPTLASRVCQLLDQAGLENAQNTQRGWDHGVFVPMKVMFPDADIPVVQLSLQQDLDPEAHLAIGRALKPLRSEGVLIIGSGQTYHNMRGLMARGARLDAAAEAFDEWLRGAMKEGAARDHALIHWEKAPGARNAQPHEDHLLPLMVAAGAASGEVGHVDFHGHALGTPMSGFRFG
jgi:aromatic ring-opening dioxygenase catalytic subunit (LigB family)